MMQATKSGAAMPVEIIGMIGAHRPRGDSDLHVIGGGVDPDYLADFARVHEESGFDRALIGYSSSSADSFQLGGHAASATERLLCPAPGCLPAGRKKEEIAETS